MSSGVLAIALARARQPELREASHERASRNPEQLRRTGLVPGGTVERGDDALALEVTQVSSEVGERRRTSLQPQAISRAGRGWGGGWGGRRGGGGHGGRP